ncbi:prepilin-type N-terminal cleavage/methylation domain-containing protein [Patescibacteria group bacterium]|nr:prepilin-type N-terminal cleavage/methylation domain-containing protein [Patescibacteria group bacterium]
MGLIKKKGFTIIELLVVLGLLALLAITAFIAVPTQLKKARDARRKSDFQRIKTALYDYYFDNDCFPQELLECGEDFGVDGESYLSNFPCDLDGEPYVYVRTKKGGGKCSQWFRLFTNLENTADPIIDKIHCRQGCGPSKTECDYNYGVASTNTQIYQNCGGAFVCAPGGGTEGSCEPYEDPWLSECPVIYGDDSTCDGQCSDPANRCQNASGKQTPEE